jgi:hypothetical protein
VSRPAAGNLVATIARADHDGAPPARFNGTQAASQLASRLLSKVDIAAEISRALQERCSVTQARIVDELARIGLPPHPHARGFHLGSRRRSGVVARGARAISGTL